MNLDEENISKCIGFLIGLSTNNESTNNLTMFDRNVMGIMLVCELLELKNNGDYQMLKDFDAMGFLDQVLENEETVDSTREWVNNNYPDDEDWLRPLRFNYR